MRVGGGIVESLALGLVVPLGLPLPLGLTLALAVPWLAGAVGLVEWAAGVVVCVAGLDELAAAADDKHVESAAAVLPLSEAAAFPNACPPPALAEGGAELCELTPTP